MSRLSEVKSNMIIITTKTNENSSGDIKKYLEELFNIYSYSKRQNKSFDKTNSLYLGVSTYFWALGKVPQDTTDQNKIFWVVNNHVCRRILANVRIERLREIRMLKDFNEETKCRVRELIELTINDWLKLRKLYPIIETVGLLNYINKIYKELDEWK